MEALAAILFFTVVFAVMAATSNKASGRRDSESATMGKASDPIPTEPRSRRIAARRGEGARGGIVIERSTEVTFIRPNPADISGKCWVIDGDTVDIGGIRIRLAGIDAPELEHPYGRNAKWALVELCRGSQVRAVFEPHLSHGRMVATCYLPDGRDLSAEMVRCGLAIDWAKFSGGKYRGLEPAGIRKKLWRCDARQKGLMPPALPD